MTEKYKPLHIVSTQNLKRDLKDLTIEVDMHNCAMLLDMGDLDEHEQIVLSGRQRLKEIAAEIERRKRRSK